MIILGPENADLNGAPAYYRVGNWRPRTSSSIEQKDSGSIPSIPFDWCDKVLEYDVRFGSSPATPWTFDAASTGGSTGNWNVEDASPGSPRALKFDVSQGHASFWKAEATLIENPSRVTGYAVFMVDSFGGSSNNESGFELRVLGSENASTLRGARGVWAKDFNYVKVAGPDVADVATTVPIDDVTTVWHRVAFDSPVVQDGNAITALDDQINYDSKTWSSSATNPGGTKLFARFGKTLAGGTGNELHGRLRNFVAAAPGRFVRAWFRVFAPSTTLTLRLVLVADSFLPSGTDNKARFKVFYASRPTGSNPFAVPNVATVTGDITLGSANTVQILPLTLTGVTANEPLWFTVERSFGLSNETRGTVHLLQAIVTPGS